MKKETMSLLIYVILIALIGCDSKLPNGEIPYTLVESGHYYEAAYPDYLPYLDIKKESGDVYKIHIKMAVKRIV